MLVALREKIEKFAPPGFSVAPMGKLRPDPEGVYRRGKCMLRHCLLLISHGGHRGPEEHSARHAVLHMESGSYGHAQPNLLRRFRHLAKECRGEFSISRPPGNFVHQALIYGTKPILGCPLAWW